MSWSILVVGLLVAANGGLVGCMLMLRRLSMISDAVVHSVLPGLVVAYLLAGERSSWVMIAGSLVASGLALLAIEWVRKGLQMKVDAAIGVVFTTMFASGIVLISLFASQVEIDADCVLFGQLAFVPLDLWILDSGLNLGPIAVWENAISLSVIASFMVAGRRVLTASAFDPDFHQITGQHHTLWRIGLMLATSLFAVTAFHAVGAVMVMAFFIIPSATAYLLAKTMKGLVLLSLAFAFLGVFLGSWLAMTFDTSISGSMVCVLFAVLMMVGLAKSQSHSNP